MNFVYGMRHPPKSRLIKRFREQLKIVSETSASLENMLKLKKMVKKMLVENENLKRENYQLTQIVALDVRNFGINTNKEIFSQRLAGIRHMLSTMRYNTMCKTKEEVLKEIQKIPKGTTIIWDEADILYPKKKTKKKRKNK